MNDCSTCLSRPELVMNSNPHDCNICNRNPKLEDMYIKEPCEHNWLIALDMSSRQCQKCKEVQTATWRK